MGKQWKYWQVLFSWAPKSLQMVTAAMKLKDACILKEKLDSILKSRDITLPTKVCLVKALVFPIVMYGWESWTIKKAEHQRIDAFELWCWRWLLRIPWIAERSNQSILKEVNPEYSLEGLMLKLQQFAHLMRRADSLERPWCWERLKAAGEGDSRGRDGWIVSLTRWTWVWASSRRWLKTGKPGMLTVHGVTVRRDWPSEQQWFNFIAIKFSEWQHHPGNSKYVRQSVQNYGFPLWIWPLWDVSLWEKH